MNQGRARDERGFRPFRYVCTHLGSGPRFGPGPRLGLGLGWCVVLCYGLPPLADALLVWSGLARRRKSRPSKTNSNSKQISKSDITPGPRIQRAVVVVVRDIYRTHIQHPSFRWQPPSSVMASPSNEAIACSSKPSFPNGSTCDRKIPLSGVHKKSSGGV